MGSSMIVALSFDVWNTLLNLRKFLEVLANTISIEINRDFNDVLKSILNVYLKAKKLRRMGAIPDKEVVEHTQKMLSDELGIDVDDVRSAIVRSSMSVSKTDIVYSDVEESLSKLKLLGKKLVILGNVLFWPSIITRLILERTGISNYFDKQFYADEIGFSKPRVEAFLYVCRSLGIEPENIVHIGDGISEDFGGALAAGLKAILLKRDLDNVIRVHGQFYVVQSLNQVVDIIKEIDSL